jgi:hypothetical protein
MLPTVPNLLPADVAVIVIRSLCSLEHNSSLRIRRDDLLQQFAPNPGSLVVRVNRQVAHIGEYAPSVMPRNSPTSVLPSHAVRTTFEPSNMRRMRSRSSTGRYNGAAQYRAMMLSSGGRTSERKVTIGASLHLLPEAFETSLHESGIDAGEPDACTCARRWSSVGDQFV